MPFRSFVRRIVAVSSLAGAAVFAPVPALAAHSNTDPQIAFRFDIPAGPLDAAVAAFRQVTGVTVSVESSLAAAVQSIHSPGVRGTFTASQALERMLEGTGLAHRLSGANAYAIDVRPVSENVEVHGSLSDAAAGSTTATRTLTPLRDVPQAVTVITRSTIADQSMQSMADVVRYVPGVGMGQGEGNRDTPILRGNSTTADFFVDGVRDDVQYFRDLYNVERVEALKGPNAMIFGRGGAGGVINRATRQADWSTVHELTVQGGSHDNRRLSLDLGRPLGALAARVTGMYENSNSYRDGVGVERYGVNPTMALTLGASTMIRAGYERFHDDRTADRGVPSFAGRPLDTAPSAFFGDPDASNSVVTVNALTAAVDRRIGASVLLRNRARFADYDKFYQNVFPSAAAGAGGSDVAISAYNNRTARQNVFNQTDLNLTAFTGAVKHVLLAGAEFGRQQTDNRRQTGYFTAVGPAVTSVTVPVSAPTISVPVTFAPSATDADNHGVATVAAVYAQDQVELSRHVQAVIGLRFDRFDVDFHNNRTGADVASTDNLLSPRLGIIYKPVEPVSLYASYSLTYVPRAGEQLSSLSLTNQSLDPEKFVNYEAGIKWDLRPALSLTAAVYRLARTNVVVPDPADATRSILVDGQRTNGVELGATGHLTRAWSVVGGYAYQDGRITQTLSASAKAGARLAQVPRHAFSLWNRYDVTPRWGIGAGLIRSADMFTSTDNTVVLPSFTRVDAALFLRLSRALSAQVNVENLLDERYFAFSNGNNNITPGSPRAVRVSLTARF
ncbi:MAG TPA: TonB-dependent siderophore receptor [Vicinamibacterales bacterium]|nr:TonB-dependent siderophore receptor [Vicinamibacterales bacterium]